MREEENNDKPGKGCSFFLNNLTIKEVFNTFTTTTVSFTTYKHAGLCTMQNKNKSVSSTLFRNETHRLQKRKRTHQTQEAVDHKVMQQPPEVTKPRENQVQAT